MDCLFCVENFKRYGKPIIIGVAGDSGSGKTRFSKAVKQLLGEDHVETIEMDGYHKENREQRQNSGIIPLDPSANKLDLLREHLQQLRLGHTVHVPVYNHDRGDFDIPRAVEPKPIIVLEGLHALYPEFLPFLDFSIFVDTSRQIKWLWKTQRDMKERGHLSDSLQTEMLKREALYKRFIDFQKTNASVVIKIFKSQLHQFARYELLHEQNDQCYKVELLMEPANTPLPPLVLPLDLSTITDIHTPPFLLASVSSKYWGRDIVNVHLDGELSHHTVKSLEEQIEKSTGVPFLTQSQHNEHELDAMPTLRFAQLLIAWRFMEYVHQLFSQKRIV